MKSLQNKIGYIFNDESLLLNALRHSSYSNEHRGKNNTSNERLEFLGDAVLQFISSSFLYSLYPDFSEGNLSKIRSSIVCEDALFEYSNEIDLGDYILLGKGEENSDGRKRPSILADAFEALIAAIYLDGGIENAKKFVMPFLEKTQITKPKNHDYKTRLQEVIQKNPGESLSYRLDSESGPDHDKNFVISVYLNSNHLACGSGKSKKDAEQIAAKKALELMGLE